MTGYIQSNYAVTLPDANYTVLESDSGKILLIPTLTVGAKTITLPAPKMGLCYKFMALGAPQGQAANITASGGATITGKFLNFTNAPAIAITSKAGAASFQFTATAVTGDYVDCQCDGVTWYVNGISHVAAGLA